jgi:DNA replication protein DnaC
VLYREVHVLLDELADTQHDGTRRAYLPLVTTIPMLIIDNLAMLRLPADRLRDLLEIVMRRCERASPLLTSNRRAEGKAKPLTDTAVVTAFPDRLIPHAHVLICDPRSWRIRLFGRMERGMSDTTIVRHRPERARDSSRHNAMRQNPFALGTHGPIGRS